MRFSYDCSLTDLILKKLRREPEISSVHLSKNDFTEVFNECFERGKIDKRDDYWFTIKGVTASFHSDCDEEDYEG